MVFTVYPEIAALKALHSLLDVLAEVGSTGTKATFVLNNMFARDILKMSQIESALGTRVAVELPYDPYIYLKAVNEGVPVVLGRAALGGRGAAVAARLGRVRPRARAARAGRRRQEERTTRGPHPPLSAARR